MGNIIFNRAEHTNNFTIVDNDYLNDPELSWSAKGLLTYILSVSDEWTLYETEIKNHAKDGKSATSNALKELEDKGYITKTLNRINGRFAASSFEINEIPFPIIRNGKTDAEQPKRKNRCGLTDAENRNITSTNKTSTNKTSTNKTSTDRCVEDTHRFSVPTIEELKSYCSEKNLNVDCERFFYFYESKGWMIGKNHMKSWKSALQTWKTKEQKKSTSGPETSWTQEQINQYYGVS